MNILVIQRRVLSSHRQALYCIGQGRFAPPRSHSIMSTGPPGVVSDRPSKPRYVDVNNLVQLAGAYAKNGMYHGTQRHPNDLPAVLSRARDAGCQKLIITGSDLTESEGAVKLAKEYPGYLYCTVGVHPCSSKSFDKHPSGPSALLSSLLTLAETHIQPSSPVVAFGEIGLDYDRLGLCPKATQLHYFAAQLDLATSLDLPLFLHSRAAHQDFTRLLRERLDRLPRRGVVHSFTGTMHEMLELVAMGFDIGVNGCSLKTEENVEVVKRVPLERLQLETDGPWCEMRTSHASKAFVEGWEEGWKSVKKEKWVEGAMVKGRNEPCTIGKVAVAVAGIKEMGVQELSERAWENTVRMFELGDK